MRRLTKVLLKLARLGALLVAREPEWEVSFWQAQSRHGAMSDLSPLCDLIRSGHRWR